MFTVLALAVALTAATRPGVDAPFLKGELLFPPQALHNHGSCVVECPNGGLLACWYRGSGERSADDVAVMGARLPRHGSAWSEPFVMADAPGFPDCNPCMVVDPQHKLWLFWVTIMDNHWSSALLKCKTTTDFQRQAGPPHWQTESVVHLKPGPEFARVVERDLDPQLAPAMLAATPAERAEIRLLIDGLRHDLTVPLSVRLGWMPRSHPVVVGDRLIVPLYSDRFSFGLMAFTDDQGATWRVSEPIVGPGNVQPTIAQRRDGTLVAYFRDNGPPPKRVMECESHDRGQTWSLAHDIDVPNPGSGLEVLVLKSGRWVIVGNDTEEGRHSLGIYLSEDEGRTWRLAAHLEHEARGQGSGSYSYPSILQARDGTLHVTYSYSTSRDVAAKLGKGESIKHVQFNEAWLLKEAQNK